MFMNVHIVNLLLFCKNFSRNSEISDFFTALFIALKEKVSRSKVSSYRGLEWSDKTPCFLLCPPAPSRVSSLEPASRLASRWNVDRILRRGVDLHSATNSCIPRCTQHIIHTPYYYNKYYILKELTLFLYIQSKSKLLIMSLYDSYFGVLILSQNYITVGMGILI